MILVAGGGGVALPAATGIVTTFRVSPLSPAVAVRMALAAMAFSVLTMMVINRGFNILRTGSRLYIGLFALMVAGVPGAVSPAPFGFALVLLTLMSLLVMYTIYQQAASTRRIFLVFALFSAGSCVDYSFALFLPVWILGCGQMRCLSFKSFLAALIGVVTPYWILWGFGLVPLSGIRLHPVAFPSAETFALYSPAALTAIAVTVITAVAVTLRNIVNVFGLNARTRAFNGILANLTFWAAMLVVVDFGSALVYIPTLAALTALQLTLYFRIDIKRRSYLTVLSLVIFYIAIFIWNRLVRA